MKYKKEWCQVSRKAPDLRLLGDDFYRYASFLSGGEKYGIMISKRLLIRPYIPFWLLYFGLGIVNNALFWGLVGIPALILITVHISRLYFLWEVCRVGKKQYYFLNYLCFLLSYLAGVGAGYLIDVFAKGY